MLYKLDFGFFHNFFEYFQYLKKISFRLAAQQIIKTYAINHVQIDETKFKRQKNDGCQHAKTMIKN